MNLGFLKDVADYLTPLLRESGFNDRGVLTPEEFVLAGDQLVHSCRTWSWTSGPIANQKKYLPSGKQFLITRNVPSLCRVEKYNIQNAQEQIIIGGLEGENNEN